MTAKQLNATMAVAGTFTYSPAPGTVLPKGTHTLMTKFKPSVKAMREGYVESSKSVTLKVE